jgi:hypothetical protein
VSTAAFPQLVVSRKTGAEAFRSGSAPLPFNLHSFWQWSASDLASNALRGIVAEFLVAQALGVANGRRVEWEAYDLCSASGATIEVKSAAYLQTWFQRTLSAINFSVAPARRWDPETNTSAEEVRRQADIYVFALLDHTDKLTLDPMNVAQWTRYVLRTSVLNQHLPLSQKRIGLSSLQKLGPVQCTFAQLREAVDAEARAGSQLGS